MPTPITSSNTIGPVVFAVTIPPDGNYGKSATVTATLLNTMIGAFQFTPTNNLWVVANAQVGTTTVSFSSNYVPATSATLGNIGVGTMSVNSSGQPTEQYSGTLFVWTGSGSVVVPPA